MHPFQKSGFVARISSRITTVIRVVVTIKQTITDLMSHSQFHSLNSFILTHAWLNLWDKHMTTGRINQVAFIDHSNPSTHSRKRKGNWEWDEVLTVIFCPKDRCALPGLNYFESPPISFPSPRVQPTTRLPKRTRQCLAERKTSVSLCVYDFPTKEKQQTTFSSKPNNTI